MVLGCYNAPQYLIFALMKKHNSLQTHIVYLFDNSHSMSEQMIQSAIEHGKELQSNLRNSFRQRMHLTCITVNNTANVIYEHGAIDRYHFEDVVGTHGLSNIHLGIEKCRQIASKYDEHAIICIFSDLMATDTISQIRVSDIPIFSFSHRQGTEDIVSEGCFGFTDFEKFCNAIICKIKATT